MKKVLLTLGLLLTWSGAYSSETYYFASTPTASSVTAWTDSSSNTAANNSTATLPMTLLANSTVYYYVDLQSSNSNSMPSTQALVSAAENATANNTTHIAGSTWVVAAQWATVTATLLQPSTYYTAWFFLANSTGYGTFTDAMMQASSVTFYTPDDTTPTNFAFTSQTSVNVRPLHSSGVVVTASTYIADISTPVTISIVSSGHNAEYSTDNTVWQTGQSVVSNGSTVYVRHEASTSYDTYTFTTVTVGTAGNGSTSTGFVSLTESDTDAPVFTDSSAALTWNGTVADRTIEATFNAWLDQASTLYYVWGWSSPTNNASTAYLLANGSSVRTTVFPTSPYQTQNITSNTLTASTQYTIMYGAADPLGNWSSTKMFSFYTADDTTPTSFNLDTTTSVSISTNVYAIVTTILDVSTPTLLSITNGEYSTNGVDYTATNSYVSSGTTVTVRHLVGGYNSSRTTTITVGTFSTTFVSYAQEGARINVVFPTGGYATSSQSSTVYHIDCGRSTSTDICAYEYGVGTTVTLVANPSPTHWWQFSSWTLTSTDTNVGGSFTSITTASDLSMSTVLLAITSSVEKSITPVFERIQYLITAAASSTGQGKGFVQATWSSGAVTTTEEITTGKKFGGGTYVTLIAEPVPGYSFSYWNTLPTSLVVPGACEGTSTRCDLRIDGVTTVNAIFATGRTLQQIVTVKVNDATSTTVHGVPTTVSASSSIKLSVDYDVSDANNTLSGLGLRIYFDSSKLSWLKYSSNVLTQDLINQDIVPMDDVGNVDGDPNTDKYLNSAWASISGQWPNQTLAVRLYDAHFDWTTSTAASTGTTTTLHFTPTDVANNYILSASSIVLGVGDPFTWDFDASGRAYPLTDGLLAIRWLLGYRNDMLQYGNVAVTTPNSSIGSDCTRCTQAAVSNHIATYQNYLDIDGNGTARPLEGDALLLLRFLFGFRGTPLIENILPGDAATNRDTALEIEQYIRTYLPDGQLVL